MSPAHCQAALSQFRRLLPLLAAAAAVTATTLALLPDNGPSDDMQGPAHILAFTVIAVLFCAALPARPWGGIAAAAALGLAIEAAQSFVPGRTGSLDDMAANLLGIAAGALIYAAVVRSLRARLRQG